MNKKFNENLTNSLAAMKAKLRNKRDRQGVILHIKQKTCNISIIIYDIKRNYQRLISRLQWLLRILIA